MLLCTTSPSSSLRSMPPPLIRGGFAAVKFYRNTVCYCETKSLCQWLPCQERLPRPGEVARKCRKGARCLRSRRRGQGCCQRARHTAIRTLLVRAIVSQRRWSNFTGLALSGAFAPAPPKWEPLAKRRRSPQTLLRASGEEALCISPIHTGIYYTDTTKWVGGNGICLW